MPTGLFKHGGEPVSREVLRTRCRAVDFECERRTEMADGVDFFLDHVSSCGGAHPVKVGGQFVTNACPPASCLALYEEHDPAKTAVCERIMVLKSGEVGIRFAALPVLDPKHKSAREFFAARTEMLNAIANKGTTGFAVVGA